MPEQEIKIRDAKPLDALLISRLIESLAHFGMLDPEDRASAAEFLSSVSPQGIAAFLADPAYRYQVATSADDEVIGVVAFRQREHLFHLFVEPRFHRRGIARRLFDAGWQAAGKPQRVTVNATPYAVPVYERWGFGAIEAPRAQNGIVFVPMVRETFAE